MGGVVDRGYGRTTFNTALARYVETDTKALSPGEPVPSDMCGGSSTA